MLVIRRARLLVTHVIIGPIECPQCAPLPWRHVNVIVEPAMAGATIAAVVAALIPHVMSEDSTFVIGLVEVILRMGEESSAKPYGDGPL